MVKTVPIAALFFKKAVPDPLPLPAFQSGVTVLLGRPTVELKWR